VRLEANSPLTFNGKRDIAVDGLLDRDLFEERKGALLAEKRTLEEQITNLDDPNRAGPSRLADFLERLDSAYSLYQAGTSEEKRDLIAKFTSNWIAAGKDVDFMPLPEVQLVAERAKSSHGRVKRAGPRTASANRLDGKAQTTKSRILDMLFSQLTRLFAARPGAGPGAI
jgi:hypothetical protein